jgi:hypothetical protein
MRVALLSLLLLFTLLVASFLGFNSLNHSKNYIENSFELSKERRLKESIKNRIDELFESVSVGIYEGFSKQKSKIKKLQEKIERDFKLSYRYLYLYFGLIFLFMPIFFYIDRAFFIIYLGFSALLTLYFAIFSPLVSVLVHNSMPIIGDVILSFESKSVTSTIMKLFSRSDYLIASILTLFSIVVPIFKSLTLIIYGFFKEKGVLVKFIEKIGKWAMVDIFVVALLVVFFSTNQDIHTEMKLEVGIYFFVGYIFISTVGSTLLNREFNSSL